MPDYITELDSAIWYINNDSIKKGTAKDAAGYYFSLSNYAAFWNPDYYTNDYIIVKARLQNEEKYIFKFKVNCDTTDNEYKEDCGEMTLQLCCPCGFEIGDDGHPIGNFHWSDVGIGYNDIHVCSTGVKTIKDIKVKELVPGLDSININIEEGKVGIHFSCNCNEINPILYSFPLEICTYFDDGTFCCKEYEAEFLCCARYYVFPTFVTPNPAENIVTIGYRTYNNSNEQQFPLQIDIYDQNGNLVLMLLNSVPFIKQ